MHADELSTDWADEIEHYIWIVFPGRTVCDSSLRPKSLGGFSRASEGVPAERAKPAASAVRRTSWLNEPRRMVVDNHPFAVQAADDQREVPTYVV